MNLRQVKMAETETETETETEKERSAAMEKREGQRRARSMVARLSFASTDESLSSTLSSIRLLSKEDPTSRALLVDAGLVPHLLPLLLQSPPGPTQELASAALLNLSISCPESLMSTPSLLSSLSRALSHPSSPDPVLQNVSATLCSLLSVDSFRPIVGSKRPILASLLSLLRSPSPRTVRDALRALFALSLYALNRPALLSLAALPSLFSLLSNDHSRRTEDATAVVAQLAGCYESVDAFRAVSGVRVLVEVASRSARTRENAASAMLNLARSGGERAVGDIREVDGVEELLERVLESGSDRGRDKAEELLKILRQGRGCYPYWYGDSEILDDSSITLPSVSSSSSASADASR